MALLHAISLPSGIDVAEAYARINRIEHSHTATYVQVQWWANQQARLDGRPVIREESFYISWHEPISLQSCYNQLKTLPQFEGATDV